MSASAAVEKAAERTAVAYSSKTQSYQRSSEGIGYSSFMDEGERRERAATDNDPEEGDDTPPPPGRGPGGIPQKYFFVSQSTGSVAR